MLFLEVVTTILVFISLFAFAGTLYVWFDFWENKIRGYRMFGVFSIINLAFVVYFVVVLDLIKSFN